MFTINMEKAKEIKKDLLRRDRVEEFAKLDVEFMRAMEMGDTEKQAEISAKKQALRDATKHASLLNAETPEELKSLTLQDLV